MSTSLLENTTNHHGLSKRSYLREKNKPYGRIFTALKKVAVTVGGLDESLKCWIFEKGLRLDCTFKEKLGCKEAHNPKDLLSRTQPYINYEENLLADGGKRGSGNYVSSRMLEKDFGWPMEEYDQRSH